MRRFQGPPRAEALNHTPIRQVNNLLSELIDGKTLKPTDTISSFGLVNNETCSDSFYISQEQGSGSSASINHRFTLLAQAMLRHVLLFQVIADKRNHMHNFYSRIAIYLHDDKSLFRMSQRAGAAGRRLLGTPRNCSHKSGNAPARQNYMRGLSR
jgi:hypothetical protein